MNITMVILCLLHGGAERVASEMANHWARAGNKVRILTFVRTDQWPVFYPLEPSIEVVPLDLFGETTGPLEAVRANIGRVRVLRQAIRAGAPDILISHVDRETVLTRLASSGLGVPHVGFLHSDPRSVEAHPAWRLLRRLVLPRVDRIIVPTHGGRAALPRASRRRTTVIPDPVREPEHPVRPAEIPRPSVVSVGGLRPEKNLALLVRAFAQATGDRPAWRLVLAGSGPLEGTLRALVGELGIDDRVLFLGLVRDVPALLASADIFAFPSLHEGFGLALAEAIAAGVPAVATDCAVGPREIVRDGIDGLLVPNDDEEAFARALARLMDDPVLRARLGRRGPEILARLGTGPVMAMWDALLEDLTGRRPQAVGPIAGSPVEADPRRTIVVSPRP